MLDCWHKHSCYKSREVHGLLEAKELGSKVNVSFIPAVHVLQPLREASDIVTVPLQPPLVALRDRGWVGGWGGGGGGGGGGGDE